MEWGGPCSFICRHKKCLKGFPSPSSLLRTKSRSMPAEDSRGDGGLGRPRASQHRRGRRGSVREAGLLPRRQALPRRGKAPRAVHGAGWQDTGDVHPRQHAQARLIGWIRCTLILHENDEVISLTARNHCFLLLFFFSFSMCCTLAA